VLSQTRTALVTGASGFLGSNLVRRLVAADWKVHVLGRASTSFETLANIRQQIHVHRLDSSSTLKHILADSQPDVVFHLASFFIAEHNPDQVRQLIESNVLFGAELLEAMSETGCRKVVNTGTAWQHFQDSSYDPVALYAATKQAFEDILLYYRSARAFHAVTLKLFDTYGPADPRPKLFTLLRSAAREKKRLDMSAGEQRLHVVYIDDVIDAFLLAAEGLTCQNLISGDFVVDSASALTLRELVQIYSETIRTSIDVNWGGKPYRQREVMVPWSKGQRLPGWSPRIGIRQGIRLMEGLDLTEKKV
jgi:nucleoside-diphosphate-sugar epimerase